MAEPFYADDDAIIDKLGLALLCELDAIAGACDSTEDGKYGLLTEQQYRNYCPTGTSEPLVATGCIILGDSYVARHERRMSNIRIAQTGRRILRRCAALQMMLRALDLEDEQETPHAG